MADITKLLPENIKTNQYLIAGAVVLVALGLVSAWVLGGKKKEHIAIDLEKATKIEISKVTGGVKAEDRWLQQAEEQLKGLQKKIEVQEKDKKVLEQQISELQEIVSKQSEEAAKEVNPQSEEIARLREEIEALKNSSRVTIKDIPQEQGLAIRKIKNTELKLNDENLKEFTLDEYIPAGSYASAVVISGVDASVGVNSQGDPRPTLFRVTSHAKSAANNGKVQEVDITGCTITGAASGDLSSERVFIRLLKMTCSREDGKVTETSVQGYIAGIGKAGVRGRVVSREGDFVMQSFLAGVASGIGSGAAQSFTAPAYVSGSSLLSTQQPGIKDIAGAGLGKGMETSGNRVSNYLIQRAEQYQPVISMPSGIDVELVFTEGVYLNGKGESK